MAKDLLGHGEAAKAGEVMTRELRSLIKPFLKPVVTEIGGFLGDFAHLGRVRVMQVLTRATEKLVESGAKPQPVRTNILVPVLQACALEDDNDMLELWSNLLASAAATDSVPPLFVQTMAALSPTDARLLKRLSELQSKVPKIGRLGVSIPAIRAASQMDAELFDRSILSMVRLGLTDLFFDSDMGGLYFNSVQDNFFVGIAAFGKEFLKVCIKPPVKRTIV